jgi:hypothetical protein
MANNFVDDRPDPYLDMMRKETKKLYDDLIRRLGAKMPVKQKAPPAKKPAGPTGLFD